MIQVDQNQIPVTFVNLYIQRRLAQAVLPTLPAAGDYVYLGGLGYEVANCVWTLLANGELNIVVQVRPQIDETGKAPFSYVESESDSQQSAS